MKIILHIGYPKCASTSLQAALHACESIKFSRFGLHHYEHLAVPLKLKGLDSWTAQWFTQEWVDSEFDALVQDVKGSNQTVVISSERLADITLEQIDFLRSLFHQNVDIEILMLYRPKDAFVKSMWRHEVFRHDLSESYDDFSRKFESFDMLNAANHLKPHVHLNLLDISSEGWQEELSDILGARVNLTQENVGANFMCCELLQKIHVASGSSKFKSYFTHERKQEFSKLFEKDQLGGLDEFIVPIMKNT